MTTYYPNDGEKLALKANLATLQMKIGLYKNVVPTDGGVDYNDFTEWTTGGGRAYITKTLEPVVNETALAAGQWYISTDSTGKASGQYCVTSATAPYLEWDFNEYDVADAGAVYGAFAWSYVLPFDSGGGATLPEYGEIKLGDVVVGSTSAAYGTVTAVWLTSGTWAAGTAAGWLAIKDKSGTFQDNEAIKIKGAISSTGFALSGAGSGYTAGDLVEVTAAGGKGGLMSIISAAGGTVDTVGWASPGRGYSATGNNYGTRAIKGSGTGCTINVSGFDTVDRATTNTGSAYAGDAHPIVLWFEKLSTEQDIDTSGQKIRLTVNLAYSSSA